MEAELASLYGNVILKAPAKRVPATGREINLDDILESFKRIRLVSYKETDLVGASKYRAKKSSQIRLLTDGRRCAKACYITKV